MKLKKAFSNDVLDNMAIRSLRGCIYNDISKVCQIKDRCDFNELINRYDTITDGELKQLLQQEIESSLYFYKNGIAAEDFKAIMIIMNDGMTFCPEQYEKYVNEAKNSDWTVIRERAVSKLPEDQEKKRWKRDLANSM